jgi:uracil-DNA glycosylase family 4
MNGEGSENPVFLFVGEAPGAEEDNRGFPFIGKIGQYLREKIEELGFLIQKCRFSNAVRCRPPNNNIQAHKYAIEFCRAKILREIHFYNPKVVVLLGNVAIKSVLNRTGITRLNGEVFRAHGRAYICVVHPSYVLRDVPKNERDFLQALRAAKELGNDTKRNVSLKKSKFKCDVVKDKKQLQETTDFLKKQIILTTDIEGSTLSPFNRFIKPVVGVVGFGWDEWSAACYPIHSRIGSLGKKIHVSPEECLEAIKELWEDEHIRFALQFGKYDRVYMYVLHGIWLRNYWLDTGLGSYALNEQKGTHGLKQWAWKLDMGGYDEPLRVYQRDHPETNPEHGGNLCLVPADILYDYNGRDCIADWRMLAIVKHRLVKQGLYENPFRFPIMWHNELACYLEINGVKISREENDRLLELFPQKIKEYEDQIRGFGDFKKVEAIYKWNLMKKILGRVQNYKREPKNPKAKAIELFTKSWKGVKFNTETIRTLLFKVKDWEPVLETKTGKPSVNKKSLQRLERRHRNDRTLQLIFKRNEFYYGYTKYVLPVDGWIGSDDKTHTSFKVHGTLTGRVSSENPNHENFPSRVHIASVLKAQFVPDSDDYLFLEGDEKQLEMRLFCDRANDDKMLEEFLAGKDPHRMGAAAGFEIPEEQVTKDQRNFSKNAISFGLLYGRSARALAADMGWPLKKAQQFIDRYFGKYDNCLQYRYDQEELIRANKFVVSYFGRIRHLPAVDDSRPGAANEAVRQGINAPIQGDASDLTWVAGNRMAKWLMKNRMKTKPINVVHDANYLMVHRKETDDVIPKLYEFMTDRDFLKEKIGWYCKVPFDVDFKLTDKDLGHMIELERTTPMTCSFVVPSQFR